MSVNFVREDKLDPLSGRASLLSEAADPELTFNPVVKVSPGNSAGDVARTFLATESHETRVLVSHPTRFRLSGKINLRGVENQ